MQRLNITSAFRRTVSGHGTGTLSSVQSPLTVCTWSAPNGAGVFSLFMTPFDKIKSYQSVRIIWSSLSNRIYTYPPHTHIHIYVLTYQRGLGGNHRILPLFLTYWHSSCCQIHSGRPELRKNYSNHLLQESGSGNIPYLWKWKQMT